MIVERGAVASRYGYDEDALHRRIQASSFIPCSYSAMQRQLSKIPPQSTGNIIYVRDFEFAQDKLRTAPSFRFAGVQI
jgi:hypothetical protein